MKQYVRGVVNPDDMSDPEDGDSKLLPEVKKTDPRLINEKRGNIAGKTQDEK